MIEIIESDRRA